MVFWTILAVVAIVFMFVAVITKDKDYAWTALAISAVGFVVFGIASACASGVVITYHTKLIEMERDIVVLEIRYSEQAELVRDLASQYPIEEKLLKSFDPSILLKLPEIKSDTFLIEQIKILSGYKDRILRRKLMANGYQQDLDWHKHRWISFTLVTP